MMLRNKLTSAILLILSVEFVRKQPQSNIENRRSKICAVHIQGLKDVLTVKNITEETIMSRVFTIHWAEVKSESSKSTKNSRFSSALTLKCDDIFEVISIFLEQVVWIDIENYQASV